MNRERSLFRKSVVLTVGLVMLLWLVKSIEWTFTGSLAQYGIYPRTLEGAIGILASPLIHGDFQHLIANSLSWLLLGIFFFFFYDKIATRVILLMYLITGILVWIFARQAYHIGFSGVLFAVASFIMTSGFIRKNVSALVLSFSILILFGGMFYGVLPSERGISWESHLLGMATGLIVAFLFRNKNAGVVDWKLNIVELEDMEDEEDELTPEAQELNEINYTYTIVDEKSDANKYEYPLTKDVEGVSQTLDSNKED